MQRSKSGHNYAGEQFSLETNTISIPARSKYPGYSPEKPLRKQIEEKSIEQKIYEQPIKSVEEIRLRTVFKQLCDKQRELKNPTGKKREQRSPQRDRRSKSPEKETEILQQVPKDELYFSQESLGAILEELNYKLKKPQLEEIVWEVDEKLGGRITEHDFILMYKRARFDDETFLEPRNLYNIVRFLMYLKRNTRDFKNDFDEDSDQQDKDGKPKFKFNQDVKQTKITEEDTLELLYVRYGKEKRDEMTQQIEAIFGKSDQNINFTDEGIDLGTYLQKVKQRDKEIRRKLKQERTTVIIPKENPEDIQL